MKLLDGNCRLSSSLCSKLSETAPTWGRFVAPWAEYVARTLLSSTSRLKLPATRLTQQHKREAKGSSPFPPPAPAPRRGNLCRGCGKIIRRGRTDCADCAIEGATQRLASAARIGRSVSHTPEARAKQSATRRRHARGCSEWDLSTQPAWLTENVFLQKVEPLLAALSTSKIAAAIGVSRGYAGRIREGYRPHPRHWRALAELTGFSAVRECLRRRCHARRSPRYLCGGCLTRQLRDIRQL